MSERKRRTDGYGLNDDDDDDCEGKRKAEGIHSYTSALLVPLLTLLNFSHWPNHLVPLLKNPMFFPITFTRTMDNSMGRKKEELYTQTTVLTLTFSV